MKNDQNNFSESAEVFVQWANDYFKSNFNKKIIRNEAIGDYKKKTGQISTTHYFAKMLRIYCACMGYKMNPPEIKELNVRDDGRILEEVEGKLREMICVYNPFIPIKDFFLSTICEGKIEINQLVVPKVYFIGYTKIEHKELSKYLMDTDQNEFLQDIAEGLKKGLDPGEVLCSFYAKMCYAALTTKKNKNISKTRDIASNLANVIASGHGSVLEHCYLNFVVTDCSRVFTHELVRHRVGTSFSQTSGRYVRADEIKLVFDPILYPVKDIIFDVINLLEGYRDMEERLKIDEIDDFNYKKKLTSAMRRILPNGQANEIGFGVNLRSLRHLIAMRTSRHAE